MWVVWPLEIFPVAQMVKNLPAMPETWVWSLGPEDPLEKGMAIHSSILWRIPWIQEPDELQFVGLQRVRYDWATNPHKPAHFVPSLSICFCENFWWVYWKLVEIVYSYPMLTYVMLVEMAYAYTVKENATSAEIGNKNTHSLFSPYLFEHIPVHKYLWWI